jgi:hypothetical protein
MDALLTIYLVLVAICLASFGNLIATIAIEGKFKNNSKKVAGLK